MNNLEMPLVPIAYRQPVTETDNDNIVGCLHDVEIEGADCITFDNGTYSGRAVFISACNGKYAIVISYIIESENESFDDSLAYLIGIMERYTNKQVLIGDEANEAL